jgi:opacity protein-like surface antigen
MCAAMSATQLRATQAQNGRSTMAFLLKIPMTTASSMPMKFKASTSQTTCQTARWKIPGSLKAASAAARVRAASAVKSCSDITATASLTASLVSMNQALLLEATLGGRPEVVDPLHTSVKSYTLMLNGYKDLGNYGGFTPYLGAGVGVAYHIMDEVYFTDNPNLSNRIEGNRDMAFAWSLMAGVGYQLSHSTVLDVGYRYIDMGSIDSGRVDSAGFVNPKVQLDDIDAHEIKVGLRYHFGGREETSYAPMK